MKTILKLAYKNISYHRGRTIFTLLCVILSVSIITIALCISDTILTNVDFSKNPDDYSIVRNLCNIFAVLAVLMSCFTICTVFSVSTQDRIKEIGFLASIGMESWQKALMIASEAIIYAIPGVFIGTMVGYAMTTVFYSAISSIVMSAEGVNLGQAVVSSSSVFSSIFWGLCAVVISSFLPIIKMRKITILETIKTNNEINISLKESILSKLTGKLFGKIGILAGQNYDNNKGRYRAISLALSGGAIFFISVHSFFLYPIWYHIDHQYSIEDYWIAVTAFAAVFMAYFVLVFLFCSIGSVHQNIEQRRGEFAIYKSMGMQNSELQKMVSIECLYFTWYSIWFGLIGSLIGTYTMCNFFRLTGVTDLKFHYAIYEFLLFVCLDIIVGFVFSLYFRHKISKINIIDTIRNG